MGHWLRRLAPVFIFSGFLSISACNPGTGPFILINNVDESCTPLNPSFATCAEACEADGLSCAEDILAYIKSNPFINKRVLNPGTTEFKANIQTPMHGLFVPTYNTPRLNDAINDAIENPFEEINMPDWSLSVKYNDNPGTPGNDDPENPTWVTAMYKIPGYCPERIFPTDDAPCSGGEWFWFLYRDGFLSFEFNEANDSSLPVWGKPTDFCLDCHGAVADADWLWITHDLVKLQQQLKDFLADDGHTPGSSGAGLCDPLPTLSPDRPEDVLFDPMSVDEPQTMFDCYSWLTFIGLNWPAKSDMRGEPDTTKIITDEGDRVWETYKQVYEMFQPQDTSWTLDDKDWNDPQPLPTECSDALAKAGISTVGVMTFQVLNETHQAFGNQFNTLVDQNGNLAQYNVRINEDEFEFIKANGYADTGTYSYNGPFDTGGSPISLPDNTDGATGLGSTEIKSAWKEMCTDTSNCDPVDDPSRYYVRSALIYTPAFVKTVDAFNETGAFETETITVPATCRVATVGLIGLHVIVKTFWAPQWIWTTFEHIDNVPGNAPDTDMNALSFNNPNCATVTPEECLEQRPGIVPMSPQNRECCPNHQIIINSKPHMLNADTAPHPEELVPMQLTRLDPIQDSAAALNTEFRALLRDAGSPFQYYVLVSTQWAADGRLSADNDNPYGITKKLCLEDSTKPCFTLEPKNLRLRNSVIESFQASFCAPEDEDISNDAIHCTPENVGINPKQVSSGGCMNCHFSSGTDFTFIWADAIEELVPLSD